jgi:hypothetical protein
VAEVQQSNQDHGYLPCFIPQKRSVFFWYRALLSDPGTLPRLYSKFASEQITLGDCLSSSYLLAGAMETYLCRLETELAVYHREELEGHVNTNNFLTVESFSIFFLIWIAVVHSFLSICHTWHVQLILIFVIFGLHDLPG